MPIQENTLVIDGTDLGDIFGLSVLDGFELPLPEPKTYTVDVPGSDGVIDLTEFAGDIAYQQRQQTFTLWKDGLTDKTAQQLQMRLARLIHGRRLEFTLGQDPGWIYKGRFSIGAPEHDSCTDYWTFPLTVTADPYKTLEGSPLTWLINAAGGVTLTLPVGRKRVCPTIEVQRESLVTHNGKSWTLEPGASKIRDLWLEWGDNDLLIDTYPGYGNTVWSDVAGTDASAVWASIKDKRWSAVAAGDSPLQVPDTWENHAGETWGSLGAKRWVEMAHGTTSGDEYSVYVQYDYQDL